MDSSSINMEQNPFLNLSLFKNLPDCKNSVRTIEVLPSADPLQQDKEAQMKQYLGRQIRVQIADGRVYQGGFWAYDNQGTMLLRHGSQVPAVEMSPSSDFVKPPSEHNVIHILQKDIVKVLVSSTPFNAPNNLVNEEEATSLPNKVVNGVSANSGVNPEQDVAAE